MTFSKDDDSFAEGGVPVSHLHLIVSFAKQPTPSEQQATGVSE